MNLQENRFPPCSNVQFYCFFRYNILFYKTCNTFQLTKKVVMENLELESVINQALIADNAQRKIIPIPESRWGELVVPAKNENPDKISKGFRVLFIGSFLLGYLVLETLKMCERKFPEKLDIVGLVTDDPVNPEAKISLKKRFWRLFDQNKKFNTEKLTIESALTFGIPVYTGEVKTHYFRQLLKVWHPDAIIVLGFGQLIDSPIINFPEYGIYNFHPSDLAEHHGAGTQPFEDAIARKADTTKFTVHMLTEQIDSGPIVGQSTPIYIKLKNGETPDNDFVIYDKTMLPLDNMTSTLISELISRKEKNLRSPIDKLDFGKFFPEELKEKLMEPLESNTPSDEIPAPNKNLIFNL